jgi:solute carrier family 35 protein E3
MTVPSRSLAVRALVYGFTNVSSTVAIVLANKIVLYRCGFSFPVSLTFLHTVVTWIGMVLLLLGGAYQYKAVARHLCLRLAAAHSACIVLNNVSLHLNTVGFYQTSKVRTTAALHWMLTTAALHAAGTALGHL